MFCLKAHAQVTRENEINPSVQILINSRKQAFKINIFVKLSLQIGIICLSMLSDN